MMESSRLLLVLSITILSQKTTGGSNEACIASCMKLVRETVKVSKDKQCDVKKTEILDQEEHSCNFNCQNVSSKLRSDTVFIGTQNFVTSSPLLYDSGYNFIALRWNSSTNVSRNIAFYILHVQFNISHHKPLEVLPSIPRYIMVKVNTDTNSQNYTVQDLVNGFDYRFRVAAIGINEESSEYSDWSPWYATASVCNRTTGFIQLDPFSGRNKEVEFPCPVSRIMLNVSIKAANREPVVLDATLNWKNSPGIDKLTDSLFVRITVKLVKHENEKINEMCAHYHDTDFQRIFTTKMPVSSVHLLSDSKFGQPKRSIHFGCRYSVKFEVNGAIGPNSFETTTAFDIPECLHGVTSCPVPKPSAGSLEDSGSITKKILSIGDSLYAANISWNSQTWIDPNDVEFFQTTLEEWPIRRHLSSNDILARDGVSFYHFVFYNISGEQDYRVSVRAYHGLNCLHDRVERKIFSIQKPCGQGCPANSSCWPMNVYDGTAKCKCNIGYVGNGTICRVAEMQHGGNDQNEVNVLAIVIPLSFVLAAVALIIALISWRVKKKKDLVLDVIGAHESTMSPSSSNTNIYENCRSLQTRYGHEKISWKENEVEIDEKEVNVIYVPQEIQDAISHGLTDGYEFNAEQIKFEECLGRGAFGYVHRARALGITSEPEWTLVAVKTLSEPVTDKSVEDFIAEIELMKRIGDHENVIQMFGCCTVTLPICLIMEYAPCGNLLTYLRTAKSKLLGRDDVEKCPAAEKSILTESHLIVQHPAMKHEPLNPKILEKEENDLSVMNNKYSEPQSLVETCTYLESFALQIANGMAYVAGRGIVHRDLAARNILIGKDYKLKISDFGLSKEGVYVKSTCGKIPLRWLSIEAIRERIYSSASDIWSYGIVLWEICTLGDIPYPAISDRDLLKFLLSGERLEKPNNCTEDIYTIMLECWQIDPEKRPTFAQLRDLLWKMNSGDSPYVNVDPENLISTA